jgi:hypothetical protein
VPSGQQDSDGEYAPGGGDVLRLLLLADAIEVQGEYIFSFYHHVAPYPVNNKHVGVSRATILIALEF